MNVALINGPSGDGSLFMREGRCTQKSSMWSTQWPPVSLAYLAAVAKQEGCNPVVFDCPASLISLPRLVQSLRTLQTDLCLFAVSTPSFEIDMVLVEAVKEALPDSKAAIFGVHATAMDMEILDKHRSVDFVIRNEPEETFRDLLKSPPDGSEIERLHGLSFRGPNGPVRNPGRSFISDLDALPFPAWDAVDLSRYRLPFSRNGFLSLTPLRGCPFDCTFCTAGVYYGRKVRFRSVDSIIEEIRRDRKEFGVDDFFMWAETFTLNRDFVLDLSAAMRKRTPGIRWTCNSRTDTVDAEMLEQMRSAGCWMVSFGIESASEEVLRRAKKNLGSADFATPLRLARKAGLKTLGHFILGLPGESPETMERTIREALALDLDLVQFYTAAPFVGSDLYEQAKREGVLDPVDFSGIGQTRASLRLEDLPPDRVDRARRRAILRFYLRPRQLVRLFRLAGLGLFRQIVREAMRRLKTVY